MASSVIPRVFNVRSYGAFGNGIEQQGAGTNTGTSLVSSVSTFVAGDVGKVIQLDTAGVSGGTYVTTIAAYVSATQVTLTGTPTSNVASQRFVYGTDDTVAIQTAINACNSAGGGKVWLPDGLYIINGALQTSIGGVNPNCQLYIPSPATSRDSARCSIIIEGESAPNWVSNDAINNTAYYPSKTGCVLLSTIAGSGTAAAVIGTKGPASSFLNINYSNLAINNLAVLSTANIGGSGVTVGGVNMTFMSTFSPNSLKCEVDGSVYNNVQPSADVAGCIMPRINCELINYAERVLCIGFTYGFVPGEHTCLNQVAVVGCFYGYASGNINLPWQAGLISSTWCTYHLYIPTSTFLGLAAGICSFSIAQFECESINTTGKWMDNSRAVSDTGSNATASIGRFMSLSGTPGETDAFAAAPGGTGIFSNRISAPFTSLYGANRLGLKNLLATAYQSYDLYNQSAALVLQLVALNGSYTPVNCLLANGTALVSYPAVDHNVSSGAGIGWYVSNAALGQARSMYLNSSGNLSIANLTASQLLGTDGSKNLVSVGSSGQTSLTSGTKAVTVTGTTTSSKAFVQLVTPSGATLTVQYQVVCTTNTITIQANLGATTINTSDGSTLNWFVIF